MAIPTLKRFVANDGRIDIYEDGNHVLSLTPAFFVDRFTSTSAAEQMFGRLYEYADHCGGLEEQSFDDAEAAAAKLLGRTS